MRLKTASQRNHLIKDYKILTSISFISTSLSSESETGSLKRRDIVICDDEDDVISLPYMASCACYVRLKYQIHYSDWELLYINISSVKVFTSGGFEH